MTKKHIFLYLIACFTAFSFHAQDLEKEALSKISDLKKLIKIAEKKNINVLKEETTIRTAELFLKFASWDEKNIEQNTTLYTKVGGDFKTKAAQMAQDLPTFERKEVNIMLTNAITNLQSLIDGKTFRQASVNVDLSKVTLEEDHLSFNNRPVFLVDYTWKPKTKELTEFHGDIDGFYITPSHVINENGDVKPSIIKSLESKPSNTLGYVFLNHHGVPEWSKKRFGPNFEMRTNTYITYDIDNPGARIIKKDLLNKIVPLTKNKRFSGLGYMLCNEPHFFTQADATKDKLPWASGPVSNYTIENFKVWLEEKHKNIASLNSLWGTNFKNFKAVSITVPLDISNQGKPIWFDWMTFNQYRVTNWFQFLKTEVTRHDADAKVHIKIMPNLWTDNKRSHGLDFESLTELSGIIGNDASAEHKPIWGNAHTWRKRYAFDWREMCMGFDFMKSVSPNKININSEAHYLSAVRSRDLHLDPQYARATSWLAHSYGTDASVIWFWPRQADGSVKPKSDLNGYGGSNNQQPRVTNEIATTLIDLNANGEEILKMQRQGKPMRIFYSETSAINQNDYMDRLFSLYESLHFEGTSLGFVTQNIIQKQDHTNWDVVMVYDTPSVKIEEINALQQYLNAGGIVIMDEKSLLTNEYGLPMDITLNESKGKLIKLNAISDIKSKALSILRDKKSLSEITITEENSIGEKGCIWKVVKNEAGNNVLSVVNVGKTDAKLGIALNGSTSITCKDIIDGIEVSTTPTLKPHAVYFVEVIKK